MCSGEPISGWRGSNIDEVEWTREEVLYMTREPSIKKDSIRGRIRPQGGLGVGHYQRWLSSSPRISYGSSCPVDRRATSQHKVGNNLRTALVGNCELESNTDSLSDSSRQVLISHRLSCLIIFCFPNGGPVSQLLKYSQLSYPLNY